MTTTGTASHTRAKLLLNGQESFSGLFIGDAPSDTEKGAIEGEAVFTTDMFAYQREMTDPANAGKVLVFATPQIGNVGWNDEDNHPDGDGTITPAAVVFRDLSRTVSNFRATGSLEEALRTQGVPAVVSVDTRGVVRALSQAQGPVTVQVNVDKQKLN